MLRVHRELQRLTDELVQPRRVAEAEAERLADRAVEVVGVALAVVGELAVGPACDRRMALVRH